MPGDRSAGGVAPWSRRLNVDSLLSPRLEALAEPSGICIGATVDEQVHGDPGFGFVDMSEQRAKNIARPIRAYRVVLGEGMSPKHRTEKMFRGKRLAWTLVAIRTGQSAEAFAQLDKAIALEARDVDDADPLFIRCLAHLTLGQYGEAINACKRAAARQDDWTPYRFLTAAYAQQGPMDKALGAKSRLLGLFPGYTTARSKAIRISDNADFWQEIEMHLFVGLRKAGIPEQ